MLRPARGQIQISGLTPNSDVLVLNILGSLITRVNAKDKYILLDISNLTPGVYYIKTDNGELEKFIKLETN